MYNIVEFYNQESVKELKDILKGCIYNYYKKQVKDGLNKKASYNNKG